MRDLLLPPLDPGSRRATGRSGPPPHICRTRPPRRCPQGEGEWEPPALAEPDAWESNVRDDRAADAPNALRSNGGRIHAAVGIPLRRIRVVRVDADDAVGHEAATTRIIEHNDCSDSDRFVAVVDSDNDITSPEFRHHRPGGDRCRRGAGEHNRKESDDCQRREDRGRNERNQTKIEAALIAASDSNAGTPRARLHRALGGIALDSSIRHEGTTHDRAGLCLVGEPTEFDVAESCALELIAGSRVELKGDFVGHDVGVSSTRRGPGVRGKPW